MLFRIAFEKSIVKFKINLVMQKINHIITVMTVFLMFFASCTNEELVPHEPDRPVLNQGRGVFNVNTGKSVVYTRASKIGRASCRERVSSPV